METTEKGVLANVTARVKIGDDFYYEIEELLKEAGIGPCPDSYQWLATKAEEGYFSGIRIHDLVRGMDYYLHRDSAIAFLESDLKLVHAEIFPQYADK